MNACVKSLFRSAAWMFRFVESRLRIHTWDIIAQITLTKSRRVFACYDIMIVKKRFFQLLPPFNIIKNMV
jgi:hypothetical protein